ncbi:MAG: ammonium transporter [Candidatus Omnitrophica bacterium]|nr:ammonium transporter [Candidatus Omnitrophota bacterium]
MFSGLFSIIPLYNAFAQATAAPTIDSGDSSFILISAALVMIMTPGLGLFYAGMVRTKNVLNMIMESFVILCLISIQWVLWGYTLSFGPDINHLIGSLQWFGLAGVGQAPNADYAATIPAYAFCMFQAMFAIITPALITGTVAERMKFSALIVFTVPWATVVYDPLAHWVWGVNGFLRNMGALDFAGGTVVHISSGFSALAACLFLGKRKGYGVEDMAPHNLTMTIIGASLLWFGWFGFNAGSALAANGLASSAFLVTNTAAAAAALSWMLTEWIIKGKPTALGIVSGAVAGLVAITPASGYVGPVSSIIIGGIAGVVCYLAILVKVKIFGYDDSLDVFGVHGVGGFTGALLTGLFAQKIVNSAGADGLFFGNAKQFGIQLVAAGISAVYAFVMTIILLWGINLIMGVRVKTQEEETGLDLTQHGESGYNL